MKVLLRSDVEGVGRRGDIVSVSAGHARNLLLRKGLAVAASKGTVAQAESMVRARSAREAKDRQSALDVAGRLTSAAIAISARAGNEGRLFGSITANDIADAAAKQLGLTLDRKAIHVGEPIRTVGDHAVPFDLGHGVTGSLTISVSAK